MVIQNEELIEDFRRWSGGYPPDECSTDEIRIYTESSLPVHHNKREAFAYLTNYKPADESANAQESKMIQEAPQLQPAPEVKKTFAHPRLPMGTILPLDVQKQYLPSRLDQIDTCLYYLSDGPEGPLATLNIEFDDGTFEEWNVPPEPHRPCSDWTGWGLTKSGETEPEGDEGEETEPEGDEGDGENQ